MKDITRCVSTGFWKDDKVLNDFSPEDKYFMLYLLTNPHTTQLGVYHLPIKVASVELGYSRESILVLLDRFENKYGIIRFNSTTSEIAIKNYLRYSIVKGGKPVMDCLEKEYKTIKDISLVGYVLNHLNNIDSMYLNNTVIEFMNKYINDNDNERYVDESYHESSESQKKGENYICAFDEFWKAYPRRKDKARAYKCYLARLNDGYTEEQLLTACKNYAAECKRNKTEERYIKHGATFLSVNEPFLDYLKGEGNDRGIEQDSDGYEEREKEYLEYFKSDEFKSGGQLPFM